MGLRSRDKNADTKATTRTEAETTTKLNEFNQVSHLAGVQENELLTTNQGQVQEQMQNNLVDAGMNEQDAQQVAENLVGTQVLAERTGLNQEDLGNLSIQQIQENLRTYEELGVSQEAQQTIDETRVVMYSLPKRLEAARTPVSNEVISEDLVEASRLQSKLETNTHTSEEAYRLEHLNNGIVAGAQLSAIDSRLEELGLSRAKRKEVLEGFQEAGAQRYAELKAGGTPDKEARRIAFGAQKTYMQKELTPEQRRAVAPELELYFAKREFMQQYIEEATRTGDTDMLDKAADANSYGEMRAVNDEYRVISDFEMNQIFDFASTLATSFLTGDAEEIDPADFAAQSYMNELDMIQLQMDETQLLAEINEAVEALIGEEEESQGEERTIADLEEEKQKELEDLGLDSKTTVKEANELIKRVQEQQQQVQKLRSPDMFVKDENGKWVLTEEAGDGQEVSYAKNPPFYSQEVTQRILNDSQSIIEENPNQFYQLAAIELGGDGRFNMGTLYDVLRGNMDLDNPEAPEVIALNYLRDPSNEEAKEAFNQMIQEPANNGIKVAVAEAFARAAGKLMNEHMSNAEKNF